MMDFPTDFAEQDFRRIFEHKGTKKNRRIFEQSSMLDFRWIKQPIDYQQILVAQVLVWEIC
jgi:hypothetical protein